MKIIRLVKQADLPACARLYVRAFNEEPWNDHWTVPAAHQRLMDIFNTPRFYGLVCIQDGEILAALFGNIERWYAGNHYQLKEMFVDPACQRSGLGGSMLARLQRDLRKKDVKQVYLFTSCGDWVPRFYLKHGFKKVGDMQMMDCPIEPGSGSTESE
jgi:aminoglycoside 6'-N-acetyltransferase I